MKFKRLPVAPNEFGELVNDEVVISVGGAAEMNAEKKTRFLIRVSLCILEKHITCEEKRLRSGELPAAALTVVSSFMKVDISLS